MANHKSALKRHRQSLVRRGRNRAIKSVLKSSIKAVRVAVEQNSPEEAQVALNAAIPTINRAASKGTIHKSNASKGFPIDQKCQCPDCCRRLIMA